MEKKDQNLIKKAAEKKIPIFIISADDECSIAAIRKYLNECIEKGCHEKQIKGVMERLHEFIKWQYNEDNEVKLPD
jgi:hypothetical protein